MTFLVINNELNDHFNLPSHPLKKTSCALENYCCFSADFYLIKTFKNDVFLSKMFWSVPLAIISCFLFCNTPPIFFPSIPSIAYYFSGKGTSSKNQK